MSLGNPNRVPTGPKLPRGMSAHQLEIAQALRLIRPPVLPGSSVIVDDNLRAAWYAVVSECADKLWPNGPAPTMFYDIAGVPT